MGRIRVMHRFTNYMNGRWGLMHRLQAGAFVVAVAGLIIGVSALATQLTYHIDRPVHVNAAAQTDSDPSTAQAKISELAQTEQATLSRIPVAAKKASILSNTTSAHKTPSCSQAAKTIAIKTRLAQLKKETARHHQALRSLQSTGLITRFLNPGMYSYKLDKETAEHQQVLRSIQSQFITSLTAAHCTV